MYVLPYKDKGGNLAGSASASVLMIIGCINLVRAAFEAGEYVPMGPNVVILQVFEEVENVLLLWFPVCVLLLMIVSITVHLCCKVIRVFINVLSC